MQIIINISYLNITSKEWFDKLGLGRNLGNTWYSWENALDQRLDSDSEIYMGNPKIASQIISVLVKMVLKPKECQLLGIII